MKVTMHRRTVALAVASALGLGGIVAAGPAVAGDDAPGAVRATSGRQDRRESGGHGMGMSAGMACGMGTGNGTQACPDFAVTPDPGTLTDQQKHTLAAMAQEEKLAHDLYGSFAGMYPVPVFRHIAAAESQHLSVVAPCSRVTGWTIRPPAQPPGSSATPGTSYLRPAPRPWHDHYGRRVAGRPGGWNAPTSPTCGGRSRV